MKRNDDLFRKLNKQKPLIKSKEIQPLSSQDFSPKRSDTFDSLEERPERSRQQQPEKDYRTYNERKPAGRRETVSESKKSFEEPVRAPREEKGPQIFSGSGRTEEKPKASSGLDLFNDNVSTRPEQRVSSYEDMPDAEEVIINSAEGKKAVQFRHEQKFYINYRDYTMLRGMLKALMQRDRFAGEDGSYFVRSLYFDDIYDSSLMEKIAGSDYRRKYRIRAYNYKEDNIRFEKKFKYGQYIAKTSIKLSKDEYYSIMAGDFNFLLNRKEELASELYLEMRNNLLRPRVLVDYDREAYIFPIEECRITFDKDIRGGLFVSDIFDRHAPTMPMLESGIMVLEVKFYKFLPEFIKKIVNNLNAADRCAISKYVICRKYE